MTKDTTSTSQKGQSSLDTKPGPTNPRERRSYKPKYHNFFLLVFLNDYKYDVNNWAQFGGLNNKYRLE